MDTFFLTSCNCCTILLFLAVVMQKGFKSAEGDAAWELCSAQLCAHGRSLPEDDAVRSKNIANKCRRAWSANLEDALTSSTVRLHLFECVAWDGNKKDNCAPPSRVVQIFQSVVCEPERPALCSRDGRTAACCPNSGSSGIGPRVQRLVQ